MISPPNSPASRLCAACGMCCNGVLFHSVRLQPQDIPKALAALGLKLRYKQKQYSILQPCPAYKNGGCGIYRDRPGRCRSFECTQLLNMADGRSSEEEAMKKVGEVRRLATRVGDLLARAGAVNVKKSYITRYEMALAQPHDENSDPAAVELRKELVIAYASLEEALARDFRIVALPK